VLTTFLPPSREVVKLKKICQSSTLFTTALGSGRYVVNTALGSGRNVVKTSLGSCAKN